MSQETISVAVHLAGCDYRFACSPAEREELLAAARHLDRKMREIRDCSGKNLAVIAFVEKPTRIAKDTRFENQESGNPRFNRLHQNTLSASREARY